MNSPINNKKIKNNNLEHVLMVHPAWHLDQHMDSDSGMGLLAFP